MPMAAKHECAAPGCRVLVAAKFCGEHAPVVAAVTHRWDTDRRPVERMRGRRLQRARAALFAASPLCVACRVVGRVTVATIRDHVVPLAEGGVDDETNVQGLCQDCSDTKTRAESQRGVRRKAGAR